MRCVNKGNEAMVYLILPRMCVGYEMLVQMYWWAYFQGSLFSEGLVIGRNFAFQKQLKTPRS